MKRKTISLMRLRGILVKEILQILRDPSSIALAVIMPIVLLFLFGYGVSLDADNIPIALVDDDRSSIAADLTARFDLSPHFQIVQVGSLSDAEDMLNHRKVDVLLHIPSTWSETVARGEPTELQLIVNGVDANRARLIQGYGRALLSGWQAMRKARGESVQLPPVAVAQRIWFNESSESRNFLVPGLLTLIMTLTGILLTALVVAREWERGTMEAMLVTPLARFEILLGKILPYYLLGMLGMCLSVVVAIVIFGVPFRGSWGALLLFSSLFLLASLGFGLLLSSAIRIQFVAAQISIVAGFLPAFFLSGLLFDLESTPLPVQIISHVVPARYFVDISHTLFMAGDIWPLLIPNGIVLGGMALFFFSMAYRNITKRLE